MYAIIALQGHQYIVSEWDEIIVDRVSEEEGKDFSIDTVLALFDESGKKVSVGKPFVGWASVTLHVWSHTKGKKIHVTKFRRKNRYQRKIWFRAQQSVLTIKKIAE